MTIPSLQIRLYGDPCLRKKSIPVVCVDDKIFDLVKSMVVTMRENKGVGLAAPQVGINQRFFVADVGTGSMAFINPKIIRRFGIASLEEGCLSIPGVTVMVRRPAEIVVCYIDENNQFQERKYDDFLARVIQHEIDHLDGKLIVDYVGLKGKIKLRKQLKEIESSRLSR